MPATFIVIIIIWCALVLCCGTVDRQCHREHLKTNRLHHR